MVRDRCAPAAVIRRAAWTAGRPGCPRRATSRLNRLVSARAGGPARRLAAALVARGVRRGGAVYWQYDFPFGGPVPWTSGFAQAVGAQALARAGVLLDEAALARAADAAFRGLRRTLLMRLGGGFWVREYGFTSMAILNAQLQSILSLESYARIADTAVARRVAAGLYRAARGLLPRFQLGCWSRYSLGGGAASRHYHAYHVDLLRRLASRHARAGVWWTTYVGWSRCIGRRVHGRPPSAIVWRRVSDRIGRSGIGGRSPR